MKRIRQIPATIKAPAADRITSEQDNRPPLITIPELSVDHHTLSVLIDEIGKKAIKVPAKITNNETLDPWQDQLSEITKLLKNIEAKREDTKAPYLQAGRMVDGYFTELKSRLLKFYSQIATPVESYLKEKRDEERRRLEAEAKRIREEEERQRVITEQKRREEAEATRKAEEARREATRLANDARAEAANRQALIAADRAREAAEQAAALERQAQARSADLARTRSSSGTLSTLTDSWDFEIMDIDEIKGAPLWPYITRDAKEKAIRKYMTANAPKNLPQGQEWQPMTGVRFFRTSKLQNR
jgi:hypothetical protein